MKRYEYDSYLRKKWRLQPQLVLLFRAAEEDKDISVKSSAFECFLVVEGDSNEENEGQRLPISVATSAICTSVICLDLAGHIYEQFLKNKKK
ncbi:MAG: hypothetical protein U0175_23930 [Caldilineaceae bacterium]